MREIHYPITAEYEGKTIEQFLKQAQGYSSRTIIKLKHYPKGIQRNGAHARTIDQLAQGDVVTICFQDPDTNLDNYIRSNIAVGIPYQDSDVVVFNKPPYMPCHQSCGHAADTLANVFATYCDKLGQRLMYRPLNRLDRDTTGAVLVAKNRHAAAAITGGFHKVYQAVVCGEVFPREGRIEAPIRREQPEGMRRIVAPDGQRAVTNYRVAAVAQGYSLVDFTLETGRTHQIRVHMAHLGFPLLGDPMYGQPSPLIGRQALHCRKIAFCHPVTGEEVTVECPLPQDMAQVCQRLGLR